MKKFLVLFAFSLGSVLAVTAQDEITDETQVEPGEEVSFEIRERISAAAESVYGQLPTFDQVASLEDQEVRATLTRLIQLTELALNARDLSDADLTSMVIEINDMVSAVETGVLTTNEGEISCTRRCTLERRQCILEECGAGTSFPCFCCVPCNLAWEVCLAACIFN